jgi:hypothetical protein
MRLHGLRRDATATIMDGLEKTECVDALKAHGFESFPERCDGRAGELVGGLLGLRDVVELPGDSRREGKEFVAPFCHDDKNLAGCLTARQARECGKS